MSDDTQVMRIELLHCVLISACRRMSTFVIVREDQRKLEIEFEFGTFLWKTSP